MQQWRSRSKDCSPCYKPRKERIYQCTSKKVDSDVEISCLTYADDATMSNWIESFFVVFDPKDKKIYIIDHFNKFGVSVCKGLAFFQAFTGCDTVSSFYKIRKAKFWIVWLTNQKAVGTTLSNIFKKFSNCPMNIEVNEFGTLCNFVYEAYGLTEKASFKSTVDRSSYYYP